MLWIIVMNWNWMAEDSKSSRNAKEAADRGHVLVPDPVLDPAPGADPDPVLVPGAALAPGPGIPVPGADLSLALNPAPNPVLNLEADPDPAIVTEMLPNPMETKKDRSPGADLVPNRDLNRDPDPGLNPGTIKHDEDKEEEKHKFQN
jgi:hypothetical protein